jgi:hypothetical protein
VESILGELREGKVAPAPVDQRGVVVGAVQPGLVEPRQVPDRAPAGAPEIQHGPSAPRSMPGLARRRAMRSAQPLPMAQNSEWSRAGSPGRAREAPGAGRAGRPARAPRARRTRGRRRPRPGPPALSHPAPGRRCPRCGPRTNRARGGVRESRGAPPAPGTSPSRGRRARHRGDPGRTRPASDATEKRRAARQHPIESAPRDARLSDHSGVLGPRKRAICSPFALASKVRERGPSSHWGSARR